MFNRRVYSVLVHLLASRINHASVMHPRLRVQTVPASWLFARFLRLVMLCIKWCKYCLLCICNIMNPLQCWFSFYYILNMCNQKGKKEAFWQYLHNDWYVFPKKNVRFYFVFLLLFWYENPQIYCARIKFLGTFKAYFKVYNTPKNCDIYWYV